MTFRKWYHNAANLGLGFRAQAAHLSLSLLAIFAETLAVLSLVPVIQYIEARGDVSALVTSSRSWAHLVQIFEFAGQPLNLGSLLVTVFICVVTRQVFLLARNIYGTVIRERMLRNLREQGFSAFLHAESKWHDHTAVGDITNTLTVEARFALPALVLPLEFAGYALLLCVYVGLLLKVSVPLTVAAIVTMTISVLPLRGLMRRSLVAGREFAAANTKMAEFLAQRLRSPRLIRLSGAESSEMQIIGKLTTAQQQMARRVGMLQALSDIAVEPIIVAIAFLLIYTGFAYFEMPLGTIGIFMFILLRLLPVVKTLISLQHSIISYWGALELVDRHLQDMAAAAEPATGHREFAILRRRLSFQNVSFRYAGSNHLALDGISFDIPAHQMTALVGPSGSGKSTLIDLLPRLREPEHGVVTADDVPLSEFSRTSLRRAIAYVPQSPHIFNVTPAQHIRYGKPDATDDEIRAAAMLSGCADFISRLNDGYDTLLGENAVRLSGGQRQRLDLARALVRHAPILVLDEPTSNLDSDSESLFRDTLRGIRDHAETTIIVIGHRFSTLENADQIVVLRDGRVEDIGSHSNLASGNSWYATAYRRQAYGPDIVAAPG